MDFIGLVVELFTNADHFLVSLATNYGTWIYAAMFVIFFLETAFVVMSFLPGDSLLFVAGTVAAAGTARPELIMLAVILGIRPATPRGNGSGTRSTTVASAGSTPRSFSTPMSST